MVDLAYANGAEAIKNQTHMLYEEMILEAKKVKPLNAKTSIYSVIKKNLMNFDDEVKLKKYVESKGMIYLSTPFSIEAAKKLNDLDIKAFKIGSGEFVSSSSIP
jgi:N-acetylneuraminate synthase